MDHFYNVMVALTLLVYFQISAISMLEINSDILYKKKKFYCVSFLHASEYGYP